MAGGLNAQRTQIKDTQQQLDHVLKVLRKPGYQTPHIAHLRKAAAHVDATIGTTKALLLELQQQRQQVTEAIRQQADSENQQIHGYVMLETELEDMLKSATSSMDALKPVAVADLSPSQTQQWVSWLAHVDVEEEDTQGLATFMTNDFITELGLTSPGVRQRLRYCLKHAARTKGEVLTYDFPASVERLFAWLLAREDVTPDNACLMHEAQVDMLSGSEITHEELAVADIPLADRSALVALLRQVATEQEALATAVEEPAAKRAKSEEIPDEYICSITHELMVDPVMAEDGHSYERKAIADWVAKDSTSPITRQPLGPSFFPNRSLHKAIERWRASQS